ncbi:hypothetical protein MUK42_11656 [Musa troglodytarum]|uniref:Uncharacterized protein n=1 Tax=Musa troglodytarum TaxID=320322 RepID=A0A9E7FQ06_9LILI|nr:hypothetical protein MUK42_11656 [Musa troglodytarum]
MRPIYGGIPPPRGNLTHVPKQHALDCPFPVSDGEREGLLSVLAFVVCQGAEDVQASDAPGRSFFCHVITLRPECSVPFHPPADLDMGFQGNKAEREDMVALSSVEEDSLELRSTVVDLALSVAVSPAACLSHRHYQSPLRLSILHSSLSLFSSLRVLTQFRPKSRRYYETPIENFLSTNRNHEKSEGPCDLEPSRSLARLLAPTGFLKLEDAGYLRLDAGGKCEMRRRMTSRDL